MTRGNVGKAHVVAFLAAVGVLVAAVAASAGDRTARAERVTLTVWQHPDQHPEALRRLTEQFMTTHPNIKLKVQVIPWTTYWIKVRAAVAARSGPDALMMYVGGYADTYRKGLAPLDSLVTPEQKRNLAFIPQSRSPATGKLYTLPYGVIGNFVFYNKELFKKAGLDPDHPPQTWNEFLRACDSLKNVGVTPMAAGFKDGWLGFSFISAIGGQLLDARELQSFFQERTSWSAPAVKETLTRFVELNDRGCFTPESWAKVRDDVQPDFLAMKTAMQLNWNQDLNPFYKAIGKSNLGVMLFPRLPNSKWPRYLDADAWNGWSISAWTRHPKEAWTYVSWMTGKTAQNALWVDKFHLPPNRTDLRVKTSDPVWRQMIQFISIRANHRGLQPTSQEEIDTANKLYAELLAGRTSLDDFVKQLDEIRKKFEPSR